MAFPKNYEPQETQSGDYTEIKPGETRLRFLSDIIVGNVLWVTTPDGKRKPERKRYGQSFNPADIGIDKWGNPERIRPFMASVVWNYGTSKIEIFETSKNQIIDQLYGYDADPDWGDLKGYDVVISRNGEGKETKYQVIAKPAKPVDSAILLLKSKTTINLEALYDGGNPFITASEPHMSADIANDAAEALEGGVEPF